MFEVLERGTVERGGGMHEHISRPEPLGDRAHRVLLGEVNRELAFAVKDGDVVSGRTQGADDRAADAARATRDNRPAIHALTRVTRSS